MDLLLRRADLSQCQELALLVERYWRFEGIDGFERGRITRLLQTFIAQPERAGCWVAGESGAVCGYLLAVYVFSLEFGGTVAEIDELYVDEAQRSRGIGSQLVKHASTDMERSGIVHVQLQLGVTNPSGRAFYERLGFAPRAGYQLLGKDL
jgi:ribosomal protein S18 acetylase RimI-like enzyme